VSAKRRSALAALVALRSVADADLAVRGQLLAVPSVDVADGINGGHPVRAASRIGVRSSL
jgi:hypothetical protein